MKLFINSPTEGTLLIKKLNKFKEIKSVLDNLWRECIRLRAHGKCEHCDSRKAIQGHHIVPKTKIILRWDLANGVCLCRRCHLYWAHRDVLDFYEWLNIHRPRDIVTYLMIKRNARNVKVDMKLQEIYLKQKLDELKKTSFK